MILSDITIRERLKDDLVITVDGKRITEGEAVQPASLDLRLGSSFAFPSANDRWISPRGIIYNAVDPKIPAEVSARAVLPDQPFFIKPKEFVLATTKEYIKLPNDLTAFVEGRSSVGRMGLFVQNAGWVDPGFEGEITLELFNASDNTIKLIEGMRIAQLVFAQLDCPAENPYNGKYQGQKGATGSGIFKDGDLQEQC